jgi:hypothetical protein
MTFPAPLRTSAFTQRTKRDHWCPTPKLDDLKKDFLGSIRLSEDDVVSPGFVDEYARICRAAAPLMQFLCDALEVPY